MLKIIGRIKPFIWFVLICIALIFGQSMAELYLPTLMSDIVDIGVFNGDIDYIWSVGYKMLFIALLGSIAAVGASFLASRIGAGFGRNLRKEVFSKVTNFSLKEFDDVGTSTLITRTTNDVVQVQNFTIMAIRMFARAPIMAIGGIIMALSKDDQLPLLLVIVVLIMVVLIGVVAAKAIPLFKGRQKKLDRLNQVLRERLTGIRVIRAFNKIDHEKKKFHKANYDLTEVSIKVNKLMAVMMPIMMLLFNIVSVAIIWFGSKRVDVGAMQVGDLMAFVQYAMQIMFSILMFTMVFIMLPQASASASRINEILKVDPEIKDKDDTIKPDENTKGILEFDNVTFRYHSDHVASEPALKDISFKALPGQTTAIIGGTGSGKSTLVNLIPRFYDIESGSIKVDNIDIRDLSQEDLRKKIGFIPQKAVLFTGSIKENVVFGNENASDEEIEDALITAQAYDFVMEMEEKLQSAVTQGGTNLSGGQKQRLSIARALVRKPEIYVFDDSFSALDFKTGRKLRDALKEKTKDATVIIIAQRVTSVMDADNIIVLENGKVAGMGTHKQLLETSKVYQEIVESQLSKEELA